MAVTHKTVKSSGGDYTSIAAAIAGSSSGSVGDPSTITLYDATYLETLTIPGTLSYLRIATAAGVSSTIQSASDPITCAAGAAHIEIVGSDATHRITLKSTSGSAQSLFKTSEPFRLQYVTFELGTAGYAIGGNGTAWGDTLAWTLEDCITTGAFLNLTTGTNAGIATLTRCVFGGTFSAGLLKVGRLALAMSKCKVEGTGAVLISTSGVGITPSAKWTIADNVFLSTGAGPSGACYLPLYEGAASVAASADVWNNHFINLGAAGSARAIELGGATAGVSLINNGCVGWGTGVKSVNDPVTILNHGFYGCTAQASANVTKTACVSTDPLLDAAHMPQTGSPWVNAGATIALADDYRGVPRPVGPAFDIGAFEMDFTAPNLATAAPDGRTRIFATFDEAVTGADLTDAAEWTVTAPFGGTAVAVASVACADGINAVLSVSEMGGDTLYRVTCPATLVDLSGNLIDTVTADFVTPAWVPRESQDELTATLAGDVVDLGAGPFALVPVAADAPLVSLRDAVLMSLASDRRANPDDAVRDNDRRGWWADAYADGGDLFGSRLWLIRGSRITDATPRAVEEMAREALSWMVARGVAARVDATASRIGMDGISLHVTISKSDGTDTPILFADLWAALDGAR
jgi:phage gp46-like protein